LVWWAVENNSCVVPIVAERKVLNFRHR
jgi:hypothetical protein